MKNVKLLLTLVIMAVTATVGLSQSLTTLFAANNGGSFGGAVYFDVTVGPNDIDINALDMNTADGNGGPLTVTVYTKLGTSVGNETNMGLWNLETTATGTAAGLNNPSNVVLATPVTLTAGTVYGIALVMDGSHGHDYTNGNGANQMFSNPDLTLNLGQASNVPFTGGIFSPRVWNGTVYYSLSGPPPPAGCPEFSIAGPYCDPCNDPTAGSALACSIGPNSIIQGIDVSGLTGPSLVNSIDFNQESFGTASTVTVNLFCAPAAGPPPYAAANVPLYTQTFGISPANDGTCVNLAFTTPPTVDASCATLWIEIVSPVVGRAVQTPPTCDGNNGTGNNTWLIGTACGINTPTSFAAIGFSNLDASYSATFEPVSCGGGNICPPPTIVCPPDMTVQCEEDIVVNALDATGMAVAPCVIIGQWVDQPHITGARDCDGTTYEYTYHVADDGGNIVACIQTWTLENDPPTITVIPGTTVECAADIATDPADATVTTSCGDPEDLDITIYAPVITGTANCPATTYAYTYRIEDQCEREATAVRTFTVQNTAPSIQAPANTTCECLGGITPNGANAAVDASCDLGYDVAAGITSTSGIQDCPGSTVTATYTVTDDCNRSASANQIFTIQNGPPVFLNAPANCLILNCEDQGWQDIIQAWLANVKATNSCGLPLNVTNNYNPNSQGVCISNGTTVVTWTARDQCNRTTTATSMIIINDTEPPVFTTPAQDELDICNYNTQAEFAAWVAAHGNSVAVDGCDQNITNNQWSTIPNNPSINCIGNMGATSVTVTFVVRDDCGNKSSSTATFTALMAGQDMVEQGDGIVDAANEFELYQNQPNPFSNETLIGFSLPKAGTATLTIYDISGKVVRLVEGDYSQGYNEVQITRSELSSAGMLYYELNTADHTAVKKMIIID